MSTREQTLAEEIANSISHGVGLVAALAAVPVLVIVTLKLGTTINLVAACVFAASMVLMYFTSAFYHILPAGRIKHVARKLDHAAIFLLIAGTYTPFTLGVLNGIWGWTLFGLIWSIAVFGLVLMVFDRLTNQWLSNGLYLAMGWLVLIAVVPLLSRMPLPGMLWLLAGGLAYSLGVAFYATDSKLRFGHLIWHLFVLTGTVCHFFAVLWYAI